MQEDDRRARIKERERAELARQIFDNPLWDEAYTALINRQLARMLNSAAEDAESLECRRRAIALKDVKGYLETVMRTGEMARVQLEQEEEAKDGAKRTAAAR
jgi:hypothetical protein